MSVTTEWMEIKYNDIFEEALRGLLQRRKSDPQCKVEDLERVLNNLYIRDGADLEGPGNLQKINTAATIAAYEHFIAEWKAEKGE